MDSDTLKVARLRYKAAYDAYHEGARRVGQRLERGESPTPVEIAEEAKAMERLTHAREVLMKALADLGSR